MFGGGESQGTARVGCSVVEGVLGDKHNTRAAESCHLANNKSGCGAASQGQDWIETQWSGGDTVQWSPSRPAVTSRPKAKPGRQISEAGSGSDPQRRDMVQIELLYRGLGKGQCKGSD